MRGGWRLIWMALLILPGGFPLLFLILSARALQKAWREARARSPGAHVPLRVMVAGIRPRAVFDEARAALH